MRKQRQQHHSLVVWREAHQLVLDVYLATESFPSHERFGIVSQLRRAAISVELNIVEGHAKHSRADYLRYLDITDGSLRECSALIELCLDLGYLTQDQYDKLESQR
ncbi:MAG: four helix bundle protein [Patescibacteria group bacterium]